MIEMSFALWIDIVVLLALAVTIFYAVRLSYSLGEFKKNRTEFEGLIKTLSGHISEAYQVLDALKGESSGAAARLDEVTRDAKLMIGELGEVNEVSVGLADRLELLASEGRRAVAGSGSHADVLNAAINAAEAEFSAQAKAANAASEKLAANPRDVNQSASKPVSSVASVQKDAPSWQSTLSVKMRDGDKKISDIRHLKKVAAKRAYADNKIDSGKADAAPAVPFAIRDPDFEAQDASVSSSADSSDAAPNHGGRVFSSQAEQELFEALSKSRH